MQTEFTTWMRAACLLKMKTVHKTGNNTWITALMDSNVEKSPTVNVLLYLDCLKTTSLMARLWKNG